MSSALGQGVEAAVVASMVCTANMPAEVMARGEVALNAGRRSGQGAVFARTVTLGENR